METIILKNVRSDPDYSHVPAEQLERYKARLDNEKKRTDEWRAKNLPEAAQKRASRIASMEKNGFVIVDDREASSNAIGGAPFSQTLEEVYPTLGYIPMSFSATPFEGHLQGVFSVAAESSQSHQAAYKFDIPGLGIVYLSEFSYSTSSQTMYFEVERPFGNISVSGDVGGTLEVIKNEAGDRGKTLVRAAVGGKFFELSTMAALERGSEKMELFKTLASSLH